MLLGVEGVEGLTRCAFRRASRRFVRAIFSSKVLCLRGERKSCLQNSNFASKKGPFLVPLSNWTSAVPREQQNERSKGGNTVAQKWYHLSLAVSAPDIQHHVRARLLFINPLFHPSIRAHLLCQWCSFCRCCSIGGALGRALISFCLLIFSFLLLFCSCTLPHELLVSVFFLPPPPPPPHHHHHHHHHHQQHCARRHYCHNNNNHNKNANTIIIIIMIKSSSQSYYQYIDFSFSLVYFLVSCLLPSMHYIPSVFCGWFMLVRLVAYAFAFVFSL